MYTTIQNGINKIIKDNVKKFFEENGYEIYYENGKMMARVKPSMKDVTLKVSGSFLVAAAGIGIANYAAGAVVMEEVIRNGFILYVCAPYFAVAPLFDAQATALFGALITPIGWFGLLVGGIAVTAAGIGLTIYNFSERKKNYYNDSLQKLEEKFFSFYNGFEKKVISNYNALKEKSIENAASFLNMQYYPVKLSESERQDLFDQFETLKNEINNISK